MTEIRLPKDIFVPYLEKGRDPALFDPTAEDGPGPGISALTSQDLKDMVRPPSIEELIHGGRNRVVDDLNMAVVRALRNPMQGIERYRTQLLSAGDVEIIAGQSEIMDYTDRILASAEGAGNELEEFAAYIRNTQKAESFIIQIFCELARRGKYTLAGLLFDTIKDAAVQKEILGGMTNIGSAARLLNWAEAAGKDPGKYNDRCTQWALSDKRLAHICATKEGCGLDAREHAPGLVEAATDQDHVLELFERYYNDHDYSSLKKGLDRLKESRRISDYRISRPDGNGIIENVEVWFMKQSGHYAESVVKTGTILPGNTETGAKTMSDMATELMNRGGYGGAHIRAPLQ